jgi:hypothetical protein
MDVIFALAYNEGVSPVTVSLRKDIPLAGSKEADRILGVEPGSKSGMSDAESETRGQENKNRV